MTDQKTTSQARYDKFNRILHAFDCEYGQVAAKAGLSDSALDVLWALCEAGEGCLQRDICEYACLGKQTVNSSVHKLVREGVLRLEPAETGRGMRVFLTSEGRAFVEERVQPIIDADAGAFCALSPEDQEVISRLSAAYLDELRRRFAELPGLPDSDKH